MRMTIEGIQSAQDTNNRVIAAIEPGGSAEKALQDATTFLHRHLVSVTHVDTGAYRSAQRMRVERSRMMSVIDVNPSATNPRTRQRVREYAPIEEARGGSHAAYNRTFREAGPKAVNRMISVVLGSLNG